MNVYKNSEDNTALVNVQDLTFRFDKLTAVDKLSLTVSRGERVALLGHNGAGKTTLFRLLLGFLTPAEGSLSIQGLAPGSTEARQLVSYLPENVRFAENLTAAEVLKLYAKLKGAARSDCANVLEQVGLAHVAKNRVGSFSKGMRQRLGLAQALLGRPALLLLDEPTSGLDPLSRQDFYTLADKVAKQGTAVLQSSHSLTELEARTDRITILQQGRLVANASLDVLRISAAIPTELIITPTPGNLADLLLLLPEAVIDAGRLVLMCNSSEKVHRLRTLWTLESLVADIEVKEPRLDDVYRFYCAVDPNDQRTATHINKTAQNNESADSDNRRSPDAGRTKPAATRGKRP